MNKAKSVRQTGTIAAILGLVGLGLGTCMAAGPAGVTDAALGLDAGAASSMTLSGATATEWRDKMGSAAKATTYSGTPTLVDAGINGLPTVHFNTSSWMNDDVDRSAVPVTIFYVSRETGGANGRVLGAAGNNWLMETRAQTGLTIPQTRQNTTSNQPTNGKLT
jgi:hypothetical protein